MEDPDAEMRSEEDLQVRIMPMHFHVNRSKKLGHFTHKKASFFGAEGIKCSLYFGTLGILDEDHNYGKTNKMSIAVGRIRTCAPRGNLISSQTP